MSSLNDFSQYISENAETLSAEVVESVVQEMKLDIPEWEKEQATQMYVELLGFFGKFLREDRFEVPESLIE